MTAFMDLLQTPAVVLPVFGACATLALIFMAYVYLRHDDNDDLLEAMEQDRSAKQQARLQRFYTTGEIGPDAERMRTIYKGYSTPRTNETTVKVINTPYSDMAATYGFETHKHHTRGEVIFYDTRFEALDAPKRMITLPASRVTRLEPKALKKLISSLRSTVNRRAQRAGLLAKRERRGNPGRTKALT